MSELKDLVPELDFCSKIPDGCFDDSALIWFYDGSKWWVNAREFDATPEKQYPAPTLAEIMLAIDEAGGVCPDCYYRENTWKIDCRDKLFNYEELIEAEDEYNPADAALKLWLEVNKTYKADKADKEK